MSKFSFGENVEHFEHKVPTNIYLIKRFNLYHRELALLQQISLIVTAALLFKVLEE